METRGHLFVIDGDLTKIACDAWLLPTDSDFDITTKWHHIFEDAELEPARSSDGSRRLNPLMVSDDPDKLVVPFRDVNGIQVFLGKIGDEGEPGIKTACREFLELARPGALARAAKQKRRPLLALNVIATGKGGMRDRRSVALRVLISEIDQLLAHEFRDVDVVLVCWGPAAESAAQVIRLSMAGENPASDERWRFHDDLHPRLHEVATQLATLFRSGDISVFMGAGVSAGAGLMKWDELLVSIGQKTNPETTKTELESVSDNRDAAELLAKRLARNGMSLEEELRSGLKGDRFSLQHGLLASLPCNEYITTNVDSLFEIAARQSESPVLKTMPSREGVRSGDRWLLKLHGSIDRKDSLVFTRQHYIDSFKANRALVGLVQSMLLTRHMLFVGYGLRDEDFHELVHEVNAARGSIDDRVSMGTVLSLFDDPTRSDLWTGTVEIVPMRPPQPTRPSEEEIQSAARDLERFIDLLGMLSADNTRFVLDPSYAEDLPEDTRKLTELIDPIIKAFTDGQIDPNRPTWRLVRKALRSLGADI